MKYKTRKKIQQWLDDIIIDNEIKIIRDTEFYIDFDNNVIGWGLCGGNQSVFDSFSELCEEFELNHPVRYDVMSFLHELGHYITIERLSNLKLFYSAIAKRFIYKLLKKFPKFYNQFNYLYQRLPDEKAATMFACQFANHFPLEVENLEKILEND